jgi:type II secretory pathway pseudopilin PulG|nr:MAG TPA: hypothetical protein [Caudoviricetes sp.]
MGIVSGLIGGALALASSYTQARAADRQTAAQRQATRQAEDQARRQAEQARADERRQNQNTADVSSILQNNMDSMLSGGSTLLTGAGGVDNSQLNLGRGNRLG